MAIGTLAYKKGVNILIQLKNISKSFHGQTVLENITISFAKGKIHGIIGENGSGKTVLLKCICGLLYPDCGTITVDGKVLGQDTDFAPNTGVVIETPAFIPYKSGIGNLRDLASIRHTIGQSDIIKAMNKVGLDPNNKKRVGKYSLGMRQRLGIAQAFMEAPDLLILDEPMNSLDKQGIQEMRSLFLDLRAEGKTILMTSHNTEDIQILCDTVHEIDDGKLTLIRDARCAE